MPKKRAGLNSQPQLISEPQAEYTITPEEQAEKERYRQRLAEFLKDPASRQIEGFPIGEDEDILVLSDPPYFTACPNPFMGEIIKKWQKERTQIRKELGLPDDSQENGFQTYHREPFASDVSEGRNDPIYNIHSYHTKVPHKAIMRYILHYTDPGDIVLDGFCGTGMTGVAAQLCGNAKAIEGLSYFPQKNNRILDENNKSISRVGTRQTVMVDLSPAATFITHNYNRHFDAKIFERETRRILSDVEKECGWMYETWHPHNADPGRILGKIRYTVWSEVFICPNCSQEMIFWNVAVDKETGFRKGLEEPLECSFCGEFTPLTQLQRGTVSKYDAILNKVVNFKKIVPILINYSVGKNKFEKEPDEYDNEVLRRIDQETFDYWYPTNKYLFKGENWGDTWRAGIHLGITNVHHFYTKRNLWTWAALYNRAIKVREEIRLPILFWLQSVLLGQTLMNRYLAASYSQVNRYLKGTLYIAPFISESSPSLGLPGKINSLHSGNIGEWGKTIISTGSATDLAIPENSVDYIFTDPPFGSNIMYSDLNFIWEAWLKVFTNCEPEAIINGTQKKALEEFELLMEYCFKQYYRSLKPGRWMTVEFHNSQNTVWNYIQEAILRAGFMIADVRTLDKQGKTMQQMVYQGAVKQDLIISSYKPISTFERQFLAEGGSVQGAWSFIRQHLERLPLPIIEKGIVAMVPERQNFLLYDRMVAFHIMRGLSIPLSAPDFYQGVNQRYLERDGMYFTPAQAVEYDKLRMKADRVEQLALFVTDEKSAVQWLRQALDPALGGEPQTYQDLQPKFIKQLHQVRHEKLPELREILEENFLQDEEENWYNPDPEHQADLEKLRERLLLKELNEYRKSKGSLRVFRSEAVRAGFSQAWRERDYNTILAIAQRLPEQVLQEDPALKMYYDNALHRADRQPKQGELF